MINTLFVTWFGTGLLPKMPGTWGSLAALPVIYFFPDHATWAIPTLFLLGWIGTTQYLRGTHHKDPKEVVIDEVVGQWISLWALPITPLTLLLGFVLFRLFDIWKPWPISWADQISGAHSLNGFAVMLDDVIAGLMAWGVLWVMMAVIG